MWLQEETWALKWEIKIIYCMRRLFLNFQENILAIVDGRLSVSSRHVLILSLVSTLPHAPTCLIISKTSVPLSLLHSTQKKYLADTFSRAHSGFSGPASP